MGYTRAGAYEALMLSRHGFRLCGKCHPGSPSSILFGDPAPGPLHYYMDMEMCFSVQHWKRDALEKNRESEDIIIILIINIDYGYYIP